MRLTRSRLSAPGIVRKRRGRGFAYYGPDGESKPNGHIQAVGADAAGRRQYLYHQKWQQERSEEKFDRVLELSAHLPRCRAQIARDLAGRGLARDRVLALGLRLLDRGYFRSGGEQYAEEHEHYGLATLLCEHVTLKKDAVAFDYPAKSGVQRTVEVDEPEVVRAVRALMRRKHRTDRLFLCRNASGVWVEVRSDDLNTRFKELVGDEYSVKDLRTWHGTVLAAAAFAAAREPRNKTTIKRETAAVMKEVADELGNTAAVTRSSYVDPRVVAGYGRGLTIAAAARRAAKTNTPDDTQAILEKATRMLIRRVARR